MAKRGLAEYIYNSAKLAGCTISLVETQTILKGMNVGHLELDAIQRIINLRNGWNYVLSSLDEPFDLEYIRRVNEIAFCENDCEGGRFRIQRTRAPGSDFVPPILIKSVVEAELRQLMTIERTTEKAIRFFLWACRMRLFQDGNKRTGMLCANRLLLETGEGILTVKDSLIPEFHNRLLRYYNAGDMSVIDQWLYEHCIVGVQF